MTTTRPCDFVSTSSTRSTVHVCRCRSCRAYLPARHRDSSEKRLGEGVSKSTGIVRAAAPREQTRPEPFPGRRATRGTSPRRRQRARGAQKRERQLERVRGQIRDASWSWGRWGHGECRGVRLGATRAPAGPRASAARRKRRREARGVAVSPILFLSKTPPPRRSSPTNVLKKARGSARGERLGFFPITLRETLRATMTDTRACVAVGRVLFRRASRKSARARRRRGRRRRTSARARRDGDRRRTGRRRARPRRRRPRDRRERSFRAAAQRRTVSAMRAAARARDRPSGGGGDAADASAEQRGGARVGRARGARDAWERRRRRLGSLGRAKRRSCVARREPARARRSRDRLRPWRVSERAAGAVGDGAVVLSFEEPSPGQRDASLFRPAEAAAAKRKTPDARAVPKARPARIVVVARAGRARACPSRVAHAVRSQVSATREDAPATPAGGVAADEPRRRRRGLARVTTKRRRLPLACNLGPRRRQRAGARVCRARDPHARACAFQSSHWHTREQ